MMRLLQRLKIKLVDKRKLLILYTVSLFLLTCPYYYLIPGRYLFFNTYFLSRIITALLFNILVFLLGYDFKSKKIGARDLTWSIMLVFITFSISVVNANNLSAFVRDFEGLLFAVMFYFNTLYMINAYKERFVWIFFATIMSAKAISVVDEFFLFFSRKLYFQIGEIFLYQSQIDFLQANSFRDRLYLNKFNEIIIPIVFFVLTTTKKNLIKAGSFLFIISIGTLALFSGWRIRLLAYFIGMIESIRWFLQSNYSSKTKQLLILFAISTLVLFYFGNSYMYETTGYSTLGRLLLEESEDVSALTSRLNFFNKSIDLFMSSPIFGIGMGQYAYEGSDPFIKNFTTVDEYRLQQELLAVGAHNIFFHYLAETGLLGFSALILFILTAFFTDIRPYFSSKTDIKKKASIVAFWLLVLFGLFHTEKGFQYFSLLFAFRVLAIYL